MITGLFGIVMFFAVMYARADNRALLKKNQVAVDRLKREVNDIAHEVAGSADINIDHIVGDTKSIRILGMASATAPEIAMVVVIVGLSFILTIFGGAGVAWGTFAGAFTLASGTSVAVQKYYAVTPQ